MSTKRNQKNRQAQPARVSGPGHRSALSRRAWVGIALGGAATALLGERWLRAANPRTVADRTPITVYASPSCQCCHRWVPHLEANGFLATVEKVADVTPIKRKLGVPESLWSCHTAMVAGYAVEGHVPADLVQRVLAERPAVAGLAAPGMPNGAPGMEGASKETYEVVAFTTAGDTQVYAVR
jgi:hypothetical protein